MDGSEESTCLLKDVQSLNTQSEQSGLHSQDGLHSEDGLHSQDGLHSDASDGAYQKTYGTASEEPETTSTVTYSASRARWVSTVALLLYAMGIYSNPPVISQYLVHRWSQEANISDSSTGSVCFRNDSDPRQKEEEDIQARVSTIMSYFSYAVSMPAVAVSLLMGTYSDVIGRRKILLIPLTGALVKLIMNIFIIQYDMDVNYFYLPSVVEGVSGSYFVVLIASFSITADLSKNKSGRVLWINLLICLNQTLTGGFVIANGFLIDTIGFMASSVLTAVPVAVSVFLAVFFLPETRPQSGHKTLNFQANVGRFVRMFTSEGNVKHRIALCLCLVLFFFGVINILNQTGIDTLYQMRTPLCWDATHIGYYGAVLQGGSSVAGVIYLAIAQRIGCLTDEKLAMVGSLFQAGAFVLEAFVKNAWMMYMVPVIISPSFPTVGTTRGMMSLLAGPYNQGAVFASIAVVEGLCSIVSNTALYRVYSATVSTMPGAVYLLMASFCLLNFFLFILFFQFYDDKAKTKRLNTQEADEKVDVEEK